jgi:hypothetical protein
MPKTNDGGPDGGKLMNVEMSVNPDNFEPVR